MIEIASYSPAHADAVVDVILPIQQSEFGIPITLEGQPDLRNIPGFYPQGRGNFWVAMDGGLPASFPVMAVDSKFYCRAP